ncbi:MAG TPA: SDR family oxidoreductase [Planctomycetota bacterium]|jgi:short-subunit dehydrogenase|nr:SDR family oxidoreductase [Planctomycetota bacterium]
MAESTRESVLITGASGGIGEEFAKLFASKGYDLVLVSRNAEKLDLLGASLAAAHAIRAEILAVDLSTSAAAATVQTFLESKGIAPDVLVNNAGFGTFGAFAENELDAELAQIQLNVTTLTHLTKLLLPGMLRRGRGKILNVASTAAFQAGPLMAVYYATKAYVLSFSEALANELKGSGVSVTCLCPGGTRTGFMARAKMGNPEILSKSSVMMEAADVARRGVDGLMKGKRLVIPGMLNKILAHATRFGTRGLNASVVRGINEKIKSLGKTSAT